ncbi:MAG: LysR family transcriptional regulator [Streptosporangiales bacterium]|nr:LysR family transcriptional regulator [Streptosporangiales bacterium]
MEQINFHRLWIFLQVVECGGFSAAGTKLFMSQPSVSNQVRQLEASLDASLVDRSGAKVRPTAEGEVLAAYARRLFLLADEAVTAVRQVQGLTRGRLAIGGTTTVGTYLLPMLLARFHREHPSIDSDLYVGNAEQVTRRLVEGELGLAVLAGRPQAEQLECEQILTDQPVVIVPPDHPLAGRTTAPEALAGEVFILREKGSSTRAMQTTALALWRLEDVNSTEVWGTETLKQAVHAGLGLSLISEHAVGHEVVDGRLATLTVEPAPAGRPIVAGHRRDRLLSPTEQAFLDLLRHVEEWPPQT